MPIATRRLAPWARIAAVATSGFALATLVHLERVWAHALPDESEVSALDLESEESELPTDTSRADWMSGLGAPPTDLHPDVEVPVLDGMSPHRARRILERRGLVLRVFDEDLRRIGAADWSGHRIVEQLQTAGSLVESGSNVTVYAEPRRRLVKGY